MKGRSPFINKPPPLPLRKGKGIKGIGFPNHHTKVLPKYPVHPLTRCAIIESSYQKKEVVPLERAPRDTSTTLIPKGSPLYKEAKTEKRRT